MKGNLNDCDMLENLMKKDAHNYLLVKITDEYYYDKDKLRVDIQM